MRVGGEGEGGRGRGQDGLGEGERDLGVEGVFRVPGVGEAVATRGGTASAVVNVRVSGLERVVE